jgi:hypothetical protein
MAYGMPSSSFKESDMAFDLLFVELIGFEPTTP